MRELARLSGSPGIVEAALHELAESHALVLTADGDAIRMAHPFSAAPMAFVVTPLDGHDDRRWWGGCAWDSLGISAALHLEVLIDTACPGCGAHLRIVAGPLTPPPAEPAVWIPKPAAQWWDDVVATCSAIRLFCSSEHARKWSTETRQAGGQVVPVETMWRLSGPWYGDRLAPDYTPHSTEQNQALLSAVGLTGEFWDLP